MIRLRLEILPIWMGLRHQVEYCFNSFNPEAFSLLAPFKTRPFWKRYGMGGLSPAWVVILTDLEERLAETGPFRKDTTFHWALPTFNPEC
ncbi:hypothetical protein AVEN_230120-1 [Araneus ventricosus]|uniref:Uncharacterized protein n=1 Tax=Araneus ventricosus TaxID=182803 RepID=A0A4Y2NXS1_ARAVE|nr:hypothetical protein AVEN_230120-1 [Araneus ventricosus]